MKPRISFILALVIAILILGIPITIYNIRDGYKQRECYYSHLKECQDAHKLNKTYQYCSGFLSEPRPIDFEIYCSFHPEEECDIPYGCIL